MKILIDRLNEFYSEDVRLVKSLMKRESPEEYYELLKWKLQMLYFDGSKWIEICRIDNYPHERNQSSHIHIYNRENVKWVKLTFEEADKVIKEQSSRILLEKFKKIIKFV